MRTILHIKKKKIIVIATTFPSPVTILHGPRVS